MLDDRTAFHLAKLCGKFGSSHDGEILSAAKMAQRIIARSGLTWDDVLVLNAQPLRPRPVGLTAEILECLEHRYLLSEREQEFLRSILTWAQGGKPLTEKQSKWFSAIKRKAEVAA